MKVTPSRICRKTLMPSMLFVLSLYAVTFNGAQVSVAGNISKHATIAAEMSRQLQRSPAPAEPDCDLEYASKADSDVKHNNCLNKIKGKLDKKVELTPDKLFIIVIDGHRDSKSQEAQALSRSRADKIANYLVNNQAGAIDADLIMVRDFNDLCPPEKSNKHNRRVQVWIVPEETDLLSQPAKCAPGSKAKLVTNQPSNQL